jgi:hypothetical protein
MCLPPRPHPSPPRPPQPFHHSPALRPRRGPSATALPLSFRPQFSLGDPGILARSVLPSAFSPAPSHPFFFSRVFLSPESPSKGALSKKNGLEATPDPPCRPFAAQDPSFSEALLSLGPFLQEGVAAEKQQPRDTSPRPDVCGGNAPFPFSRSQQAKQIFNFLLKITKIIRAIIKKYHIKPPRHHAVYCAGF